MLRKLRETFGKAHTLHIQPTHARDTLHTTDTALSQVDTTRLDTMTQAAELIATGVLVEDAARQVGTTAKTLRQWAAADAELGAIYARARLVSAGALEDEALAVARASDAETYGADRLRVDTLKWAAAKRHPKEYGDKQTVENDTTVRVIVERTLPGIVATAQLAAPQQDTDADTFNPS